MAPTRVLNDALEEEKAHDDFAGLSGATRVLVIETIVAFGREALLNDNGAADSARRIIVDVTQSPRLGDAVARAVRAWARGIG